MRPEDISTREAAGWNLLYKTVLQKGSFETEYRFHGIPRVLHLISKCLIRDEKVFGICTIAQDITEKRCMEEALRKSEEKFSKAFLHSPTPLMLSSMRDHRYLEVNQAFLDATGYQREELIGKTAFEVAIWVQPEQRTQLIHLVKEGRSYRGVELAFRTKAGEIREALGSATKIEIDGEPCLLSVAVDVTERKRVTEALRESEERLRMAIESGPWYAFEWDPSTDEVRGSEKRAEILDSANGSPIQSKREFIERIHSEDRQKYMTPSPPCLRRIPVTKLPSA